MPNVHLVLIGKLKDKNYLSLESDYKKRFKKFSFKVHECKSHQENLSLEMKEIENKLNQLKKNQSCVFVLTEHGKTYKSTDFSKLIFKEIENSKDVILIIGGASGFPKDFLSKYKRHISLSPMTLPHQMARLVLIEQLYRAETIASGHPYHKD